MARTTGPVLVIGAITVTNEVIFHDREMDWRVPIAAGIAAMGFGLAEQAAPRVAVALAYAALITSLFVSVPGDIDPPIVAGARWFNT